ncbi:MAG: hypothetical protein AAF581_18745 [Planctomycetota bacterium]
MNRNRTKGRVVNRRQMLRLGLTVMLLAPTFILGGCRLPEFLHTDRADRVTSLRPLVGSEISVGMLHPLECIWVTAEEEVRLRYGGGTVEYPVAVVFYYRAEGETQWLPGPVWRPGSIEPFWTPPSEGRWQLIAEPYDQFEAQRISAPGDRTPQAIVAFDWTQPRLQVDSTLPEQTVAGGSRLNLSWRQFDNNVLPGGVVLEMSESPGAPWERVTTLPDFGRWTWNLPNRAIAGARLRLVATDAAGNSSDTLVPGVLTVNGLEPVARLIGGDLRANAQTQEVPFSPALPGGGELVRSELWVSADNGAQWRLAGHDLDGPPFDAQLAEGAWGIWIVVEDDQGNRSPYPTPGDSPQGQITVDWTAPVVGWGGARLEASNETTLEGLPMRDVVLAYAIEERELNLESLRVELRREHQAWRPLRSLVTKSGELRFPLIEGGTGPTQIRLRGRDLCGNEFRAEQEIYTSDLVSPPQIAFTSPPSGWHHGGETLLLSYRVQWTTATANPVDLSYSHDGVVWRPLAEGLPAVGDFPWTLPKISEEGIRVRMTVRSEDGRVLQQMTPGFSIDSVVPTARIVGPHQGYGEKIKVLVEASDQGGSGLQKLELFARRTGAAQWQHAGTFRPDAGHLDFSPPDPGEYQLCLVPTDAAGNHGVSPSEAKATEYFALNARSGPPNVQLVSFQDGGVYAGGSRHMVFVAWPEGEPVAGIADLQFSSDDGGTWTSIGRFSMTRDHQPWVLPEETIEKCRLRVVTQEVSGRRTVDQTRTPFRIDAGAPQVTVQKVTRSAAGPARVHATAVDPGGAGVHRLWVYYTEDEGEVWQRWGEPFLDGTPIELDLTPGNYGFVVVAEDRVGNVGRAPVAGRRPTVLHRVSTRGGVDLQLLNPTGGVLAGGTRHYVFWRLDPSGAEFPERPVAIYTRVVGGEWELLKKALPAVGREPWYVPENEGAELELRVVATALDGTQFEAQAADRIRIDSRTPQVFLAQGPNLTSAGRPTEVKYKLAQPDRLREVELWIRAVSTPEWRRVVAAPIGEPLTADIADGMYRVALVAVDEAGNRGRSPAPGDPGAGDLLVDTQAPLLVVDQVGERESVFLEGDWCVLRPRVQDRHLSAFPLSFRISTDGGVNFEMLKRYHSNGEEYPVTLPSRHGPVVIEVTAEDLAGNRTREQLHLQVIPRAPEVRLLTEPAGGILRAGDEMRIEWESRGVDPLESVVSLAFTADGTNWTVMGTGLSADGHHVWKVPTVDSNRCRLRLTVLRPDGISSATESGRFTISSTPPDVKVEGVVPKPGRK